VAAAVIENVGYRQILALWRMWGAAAAWRGRAAVWGAMQRIATSRPN